MLWGLGGPQGDRGAGPEGGVRSRGRLEQEPTRRSHWWQRAPSGGTRRTRQGVWAGAAKVLQAGLEGLGRAGLERSWRPFYLSVMGLWCWKRLLRVP